MHGSIAYTHPLANLMFVLSVRQDTHKKTEECTHCQNSSTMKHFRNHTQQQNNSTTWIIPQTHNWVRPSVATKLLSGYVFDNWCFALCVKVNFATALNQDYLHARHCAFYGWFNLSCFVLWVTEKQPCVGEEFHFIVNGMEMIQYKNTQMKWKGVEENSRRAPCSLELSLVLFYFSLRALSLKIVR